MHAPRASFFIIHKRTIAALFFGFAFTTTLAYAVPPLTKYSAGATLDPNCAPGDTNCSVDISGGSQWDDVTGGINYAGGNVGIGTTSPSAPLTIESQSTGGGASFLVLKDTNEDITTYPDALLFGINFRDFQDNPMLNIYTSYSSYGLTLASTISSEGELRLSAVDDLRLASSSGIIKTLGGQTFLVDGTFRYTDGNQQNGYVLTSDANGNASWENLVFPSQNISIVNTSSLFSTPLSAGTDSLAVDSVFLGGLAGNAATNADVSVFIGSTAGYQATDAVSSSFIGGSAGYQAANATNSVFIGQDAGAGAVDAANSIFIGAYAGMGDPVDNTGFNAYSIGIGFEAQTGGFSNSIALGHMVTNTATNQFMIGSTSGPIDTTRINGSASTQCTITTGTGIACTSDERLKTDIQDLSTTTLDNLLNVRTIRYRWLQNQDSPEQIGFLAQDLEQYFPQLVATDSDGYKSVYYAQMTPILVEAIREINQKIVGISDIEESNSWRTALTNWFASAGNGIGRFFAREIHTETICVKKSDGNELCLNGDQLQALTEGSGMTIISNPETPTDTTPTEVPPETDSPETEEVAPAEGEPEVTLEEPQTTVEGPAPESDPVPETPTEPAPAE